MLIATTQEQCNQLGQLVAIMYRLESAVNKSRVLEILMEESGFEGDGVLGVRSHSIQTRKDGGAQVVVDFEFADDESDELTNGNFYLYYNEAGKLTGDF